MCPLSEDPRGRAQGRSQLRHGPRGFRGLTDGGGRVRHGAAQREGFPDREHDRVQRGPGRQPGGGGLGGHRPVVGDGRRRLGREVEDHAVQVGARDSVDHAVMHLRDQGPAALGESFGHPVLPQRVIAVEPLRHHPGHQIGELLVPAGRRQSGAPDVVPDIEVRVLHPDRPSEAERHRAQLVAVARDPRQAPGQVSQEFLMGGCWSLEHRDRGDRHRHVRVSVLRIDKHGVQRVQPVHDGLLTRPRRARRMLEKSSLTSMVGRAAPAGPGLSSWPAGTFGSRRWLCVRCVWQG